MKPNIPLTWMTRQLKEMVEKDGEGTEEEGGAGGDSGTLTRRGRGARADDSTLKRHHTIGGCSKRFIYTQVVFLAY